MASRASRRGKRWLPRPNRSVDRSSRGRSDLRALGGFSANAGAAGDERRVFVFFAMLFGVAAMLALIACSNVAGLLLARRFARHRELTIRQALGANRWQLARPLLAEAVLLVTGGAALGLWLDAWLRGQLSSMRWPTAYNIPFEFHFESDRGLLLYALLTAFAALVVCSLGWVDRRSLASAVRQEGSRSSLRNGFVALQVVLSMVLLTLGTLFARSFVYVASGSLGFDAAHTVIAMVHPLPHQYQGERGFAWRERLIRRVRSVPGVIGVTSTGLLPLMGEVPAEPLRRQGEPVSSAREIYAIGAGEDYFATLNIHLLRGRDFELADRGREPIPTVVNRTLERQLFGDADPIGALLARGREKSDTLQIVGVAADCKMRTLGESAAPAFYTPDFNGQLLVRVAGDPTQWLEPLRAALAEIDSASALDIRPMRDAVAGALFPMQVAAVFVGSLSALGLVLALVGVYGSVSYAVGRRTREMGIRAALGATRARILWTVLREGAALMGGAVLVGTLLALSAVRPLADLLPDGLNPWDPRMFIAVMTLLMATGVTAAAVPARRAAKVDPMVALRED